MSAKERRFQTAFRQPDTSKPGLIQEDDGTVWLVNPDGTRTQLTGGGGGGGGAPSGPAGGVLGGTYPNPDFAVDMATQAELDAHAADTTNVHGITDTSALLDVTTTLDEIAAPVADVSLNNQKITGLGTPTVATDAATKAYADAVASGLDVKMSVRAATTAAVTLSGEQTIDDVVLTAGDRVLVKNQAAGATNGIYVVAVGAWARSTDADTSGEVTAGLFTFVEAGTVQGDQGWVLATNNPITLGTTVLVFTQFSGAGGTPTGAAGGDLAGSTYPNPVIAANAVTTGKILDDAVTAAKIAANAVGSSELANDAVDTAAIQDGAVTAVKVAADVATQAELDAVAATAGAWRSTHLIRYVDYVNGNDSNSGLSPLQAQKTIAHAYADLITVSTATYTTNSSRVGVGRIILMPGAHDVGTGLAGDYRYPVEIFGFASGTGYYFTDAQSLVYSSSGAATEFFRFGNTTSFSYGWRCEDVLFRVEPSVNTSLTACVRVQAAGHWMLQHLNSIVTSGVPVDVPLVVQGSNANAGINDNAWGKMLNCVTSNTPMYHADTTGIGAAMNRLFFAYNVCEFGVGATFPMWWLEGFVRESTFIGNAWDGGRSGPIFKLGSDAAHASTGNYFINNSGESGDNVYPVYDVVYGGQNHFIGGRCDSKDNLVGDWINFHTNAYPNRVDKLDADYTGLAGWKQRVVDNSTYPTRNQIYNKDGRLYPYKSGAGATFSASDFPANPLNGSIIGISHDTNFNRERIHFFANGTYSQVTSDIVIGVTQRKFLESTAQTSTTAFSPGTAIQAGTLAVMVTTSQANKTVTGVTDSHGNTWTVDNSAGDGTRTISYISCQVATTIGTGDTITITWSAATSADPTTWILELTNCATTSAFDKTASGSGTGTALATSASAALAQANEIVIGCFRTTATLAGWTKGATYTNAPSPQTVSGPTSVALEYKLVNNTAAVTADGTWSSSGTWYGALATYKARP